jgi:hypothetical protein
MELALKVYHIIFIIWAIVFVFWAVRQFKTHNQKKIYKNVR